MKKTILSGLLIAMVSVSANASDGGAYIETETFTNHVSYTAAPVVYVNEAAPAVVSGPCKKAVSRPCENAKPVRVKTHTEVIDHYQVYRPVTVYQPAGTYAERRVVKRQQPCSRCGF